MSRRAGPAAGGALRHPVALQPTVIDVVEIVASGLTEAEHVHHVEVPVARRFQQAEASLLRERREERRHHRLRARRRHDGANVEQPVVARDSTSLNRTIMSAVSAIE